MNANTKKFFIEKMARAMTRGFWSGSRPHEKRMLTLAGYALDALLDTDEGQKITKKKTRNKLNYLIIMISQNYPSNPHFPYSPS
jgi:hypothetical protein